MQTAEVAPPATPPPPRLTPWRVVREAWRRLRTMRTALILLFTLAAGASVGSLIPQRPANELRVAEWMRDHSSWVPLANRFGLFDVYGSWWFTAIYVLLLVSVVGCIVPRYRAMFRQIRSRPRTGGPLDGFPQYHENIVDAPPDAVLADAERVLRRGRFRLVRANGTIAGEKGHLREAGSIIFHTAFLILLLGIVLGKGFGFTGQVAVVEGDRFTDTNVSYDQLHEGRFFGDRHRGFSVQLDDFAVRYQPNGVPKEFASYVRLYDDDKLVRRTRIRVNEPLVYRGVNVFQLAWGWAPRVVVSQNGKVLSDAPVIVLEDRRSGAWRGVVKVPQTKPAQLGIELYFYNDLDVAQNDIPFNRTPLPRRPVIFFQTFRGDLGLDRPQSVYALDKTALAQGDVGGVPVGGTVDAGDGITVSFPDLRQYSVFQVGSDPGTPFMLAAAVLILVGLIPALYSSRRRVWVRAIPDAAGSRVEVAGQALQRKGAFEEEFKQIVRNLGRDLARSGTRDG
ncbi:MAG: cytochrome c biogenesis protein ResB [Actinomycetota bacterium]